MGSLTYEHKILFIIVSAWDGLVSPLTNVKIFKIFAGSWTDSNSAVEEDDTTAFRLFGWDISNRNPGNMRRVWP